MSDTYVPGDEEILQQARRLITLGSQPVQPHVAACYRARFGLWEKWADSEGIGACPADQEHVAVWAWERYKSGRARQTVWNDLSAIGYVHWERCGTPPGAVVALARRALQCAFESDPHPAMPARPVLEADIARLIAAARANSYTCVPAVMRPYAALRDPAATAAGYFGAFRPGELGAVCIEDIVHQSAGMLMPLRKSKTNPFGVERDVVFVERHPDPRIDAVRAVEELMAVTPWKRGPLFAAVRRVHDPETGPSWGLDERDVSRIVSKLAVAAGLEHLTGMSLRRGLATTAYQRGADLAAIAGRLRQRRPATTARYISLGGRW